LRTTIIINPEYKHFEESIRELPNTFSDIPDVIQAKRNIIKETDVNGLKLNIKRYRKPILINRLVYTFFRKPKAYKAYYNALEVINRGFQTPLPIAYIEEKESGLLSLSYFISTQLDNIKEIREYYFTKAEANDKSLLKAFAWYTAGLHDAGILHLDYSPGNILISQDKHDNYIFSLVDINRMQFQKVSVETGCENFCRLFEYDEAIEFIASEYATARKLDKSQCTRLMLHYKHQFEKKKERKKQLKKLLKKTRS